MSAATASIAEALASVDAVWDDGVDVSALSDTALMAANKRIADTRRLLDATHAKLAAEIASRSRPDLGKDGLARRSGFHTPGKLIAAATGGHTGDAARLITSTPPRVSRPKRRSPTTRRVSRSTRCRPSSAVPRRSSIPRGSPTSWTSYGRSGG